MKQDGLLGVIVVSFFIISSLWVQAAEKPARTPKPAAPTSGAINQNRADAIGKSCEQWQKRRVEACKKAAPEKKKQKQAEEGTPAVPKPCTGETSGKEKKLCDDEKRFVLTDKQYGVEYQFTCDYEGKLGDRDRLSPAFRTEVTTGDTRNITGRGYCVADHRIRDLFKDKAKCAQAGNGTGYGTQTDPKSKDNCRGGVVQMAGDFDDKVMTELNTKVRCFEASTGQGERAKPGEVGVISGYAGDAKRRVISFCRDDQKEVSDILRKKAEDGALAYDKEAKKFVGVDPKTDSDKTKAKESLKDAPFAPDASATNAGDTKPKPAETASDLKTKEQRAVYAVDLDKKAEAAHAATSGERRAELDKLKEASGAAEAAREAYYEKNKRKDVSSDAQYLDLVRAEARANAAYNRSLGDTFYHGWLRYYQALPQTDATRAYIEAYRAPGR